MNGVENRDSSFGHNNFCKESIFTKNEEESKIEEDSFINMSQVEESLKTLITEGDDDLSMYVGSPVQNDSSEGGLNHVQNSLRIININDKKSMEPDMNLNQSHLNRRLVSTSSLSSKDGRPNKSIAVVSMKNLLSGLSSSNYVDSHDEGDSNGPKAPVNREERIKLLQDLLEFYMSDRYLIKDLFFLKRNKGWISIKFLLSYKRIKRIAKDIDEVKEAIKMSPLFEMNKEETKVQRVNVLPNCIRDYIPSKIAIVGGLPEHFKSINEASRLMNLYGDVVSLQLLRPGGALPEVLQTVQDIPEIRTQWSIVVEYDEMQSAGKLVNAINKGSDPNLPSWAVELVISWKEGPNKKSGKNKRNTQGLTKKECLFTSIKGAEDQKKLSNGRLLNQLGQQQQQSQQQHLQPHKGSNPLQNFKSSDRHNSVPSTTKDDNWRSSNHLQVLKLSERRNSDPSIAEDDNWRSSNHLQVLKLSERHKSDPSIAEDDNWRSSNHLQVLKLSERRNSDPSTAEDDNWRSSNNLQVLKLSERRNSDPSTAEDDNWRSNNNLQVLKLSERRNSDPSTAEDDNWRSSNHLQVLKLNDRRYSDPSSADDNWRSSNHIQKMKSISRYNSEASSADSNWRKRNHNKNLKIHSRHHSEPSSADTNWRTPINVDSIDEEKTYLNKNTRWVAPAKTPRVDRSHLYISTDKIPKRF